MNTITVTVKESGTGFITSGGLTGLVLLFAIAFLFWAGTYIQDRVKKHQAPSPLTKSKP